MSSTTVARVAFALFGMLSFSPLVLSDPFTWNGADGAKWEVVANWNQNGAQATRLPGAEDDVTLSVPQDQDRKKVLLGNAKLVKSLVVENISLEPDAQASVLSVSIESTNDAGLDGKSQVVAATVAQGDAGSVTLTSKAGKLTLAGKIQAGRGGNPQKGKGGSVTLTAKGLFTLTGTVEGGTSYDVANNQAGGSVLITSRSGNIEIKGRVDGGSDAGNGTGGFVNIRSEDGDEVLIDHTVFSGNSGGSDWTGGSVIVTAPKNGAEIKLGPNCKIQAGEGAAKVMAGVPFGKGGSVRFSSPGKVTDQQGASVKAGKGGFNGGTGGYIQFLPVGAGDPSPSLELKNGTYVGGDGGLGGGRGGDVQLKGKSLANGKNIQAGNNGANLFEAAATMGNVTAVIETPTSILPGGSVRAGVVALISDPGGEFILRDLDEEAVFADASICIGGSAISNPSVVIDLTDNPAGENVLVTGPGGQITLRGSVLLDRNVDLSDITEPDATISSLPCPCVAPPEEIWQLSFGADSSLSWIPLPFVESYEVLSGLISHLPVGTGGGDEICQSGLLLPSISLFDVPPAGDGYWYLVRSRSSCGIGSYGYGGLGAMPTLERLSSTCN